MSSVNTGKKKHSTLLMTRKHVKAVDTTMRVWFFWSSSDDHHMRFCYFFPKAKTVYRSYIRYFWLHRGFSCTLHSLKHRTNQFCGPYSGQVLNFHNIFSVVFLFWLFFSPSGHQWSLHITSHWAGPTF